jgi:hypothetical protein
VKSIVSLDTTTYTDPCEANSEQRDKGGTVAMEESARILTSTAVQQPERPTGTSRGAWRTYWRACGQRWRTEPEIDEARQQELATRREVVSSIARGVYPFR